MEFFHAVLLAEKNTEECCRFHFCRKVDNLYKLQTLKLANCDNTKNAFILTMPEKIYILDN